MSIIDFNSSIWSKPWFRKLPPTAKILFIYLWTNNHKNLIGMYEIDFDTIQFETGLNKKQITDTLLILYPKIKYDTKKEIVWIVNHVRHQFMRTVNISPKIVAGIDKCLISLKNHSFTEEFIQNYNTLSIGYQYPSGGGEGVECIGEGEGEEKGDNKIERRKPCASIDLFWQAYPKKKSKGEAEKAWATLRPDEALLKVMLLSIEKAKKTEGWEKEGGKYIPNPATWLRAKGWEDEIGEIDSNRSNKVRACKGLYYSVTNDLEEESLDCPQRFDCPTYIGNLKDKDVEDLIYIRHDHPKIYNPSTEECGFNKAITQG